MSEFNNTGSEICKQLWWRFGFPSVVLLLLHGRYFVGNMQQATEMLTNECVLPRIPCHALRWTSIVETVVGLESLCLSKSFS